MTIIMRALCFIGMLCLVATSGYGASPFVNTVAKDFAPADGYVVQQMGEEYLIDQGTAQGIAVGDLFSVMGQGIPITHPISGKVLGNEDRLKGRLQVTRLKEAYSYSRPLGTADGVKRGNKIRRYQDMAAMFWDYTGQGRQLAADLQAALPHLLWQDYDIAQQKRPQQPAAHNAATVPSLYFILNNHSLEVRSPDFKIIRSYPAPVAATAVTAVAKTMPPPLAFSDNQQRSGNEPVWSSTPMKGTPVGIATADFDGDGKAEVAIAFPDRIEIGRITNDTYQALGTVRLPSGSQAYALDTADLNADNRLELYLSAMNSNGNPGGVAVEFQDGRYKMISTQIPWHLRQITLPGEGAVLLAQEYNGLGTGFSGPIFRVKRFGNRLTRGDALVLPKQVNLYGCAAFSNRGDTLFSCLDAEDYLTVIDISGKVLFVSTDKMGGSEVFFEIQDEVSIGGDPRPVYLKPRIAATADGTLLVPTNKGFSMLSKVRIFNKSELQAYRWNGKRLREVWSSAPNKSSLSDFHLFSQDSKAINKILSVVLLPPKSTLTPREFVLQLYEMQLPM